MYKKDYTRAKKAYDAAPKPPMTLDRRLNDISYWSRQLTKATESLTHALDEFNFNINEIQKEINK